MAAKNHAHPRLSPAQAIVDAAMHTAREFVSARMIDSVGECRLRSDDADMRSVWICSRNDAIGNIAVVLAVGGVFGLNSAWPDLVVAALMAVLGLSGGFQIMRQARAELRPGFMPAPSSYRQPLHGNR